MRDERNIYENFVGNPEGKIPLAIFRCRWEDNIKMGHIEWDVRVSIRII
jgi:hypothetical protein